MVWRGQREQGIDYFDDILGSAEAGIHSGAGLADFDAVREKYSSEGLAVTVNCRFCNKGHQITMEWPELYIVGLNRPGRPVALPAKWKYSNNNRSAYLELDCTRCHNPGLALHVTPDEARRHVQTGLDSGNLAPGVFEQLRRQYPG
jgi:hypothetical protein